MSYPTRRQFLKHTALAAGALSAAPLGCGKPASHGTSSGAMSIARWAGTKPEADDPGDSSGAASLRTIADRLTRQAMADLGGMERFVKPGDVVWIKPNIGFRMVPEFAANTSPDVVATLVNLCIEAGAKQVRIGDNSCYGQSAAYPMKIGRAHV